MDELFAEFVERARPHRRRCPHSRYPLTTLFTYSEEHISRMNVHSDIFCARETNSHRLETEACSFNILQRMSSDQPVRNMYIKLNDALELRQKQTKRQTGLHSAACVVLLVMYVDRNTVTSGKSWWYLSKLSSDRRLLPKLTATTRWEKGRLRFPMIQKNNPAIKSVLLLSTSTSMRCRSPLCLPPRTL